MLEYYQTDVLQEGLEMILSLEQKEQLAKVIKRRETQLKRVNISINSGMLWCKAINIILNGGNFQTVIKSLEAYPQESLFVA
jgi:hypothetical protein